MAVWQGVRERDELVGAAATLGERAADALWSPELREWSGERCDADESPRIRLGLDTWARDPNEKLAAEFRFGIEPDENSRLFVDKTVMRMDLGFRTATGDTLLTEIDSDLDSFEPIAREGLPLVAP